MMKTVGLNIISCSSTGQYTFAVRVVILYLTIYPVIIPFGLHGSPQYNVTDVELTLRMSTDSGCSGTEITELSAKIYYKHIIVPNIRTIVR
jgi:hypothetical protein